MRIYQTSLAKTVDSVNEAYFFNQPVTRTEREKVAAFIAGRESKPGAYGGMFAPTSADQKNGIRLFTGEEVPPSAALRHISGEEACRALILLDSRASDVQAALARATTGMLAQLDRSRNVTKGFFCCGKCDPSLWRHISAGGLRGAEMWLEIGLKTLRAHRIGNGQWQRFPFWFTLLALIDVDHAAAIQEMRYAASRCERSVRTTPTTDYARRRRAVAERILTRC